MLSKPLYHLTLACATAALIGCHRDQVPEVKKDDPAVLAGLDSTIEQCLVVAPKRGSVSQAILQSYEKTAGHWQNVHNIDCLVGKNGFAPKDQKKEGDGKTPSGIYAISAAFGYGSSAPTRIPYSQVTEKDFWIDDPKSSDYNKQVKGKKPTVSHELLRRDDDAYKFAAIIEYNRDPIVPGKGSAIFLHVSGPASTSTAGCVAVREDRMVELLKWLDSEKRPHIVLNEPDGTAPFYDNTQAVPIPK